ncbi:MAG: hypothetical protein J7641_03025 [Cyanobacteria bacterium SID2]|nr:hypothetical protein [Cyanobacteria bacterium SID2]MBP0006507.1 hypothetical protein [Cyanobacteria bacterium SBC]
MARTSPWERFGGFHVHRSTRTAKNVRFDRTDAMACDVSIALAETPRSNTFCVVLRAPSTTRLWRSKLTELRSLHRPRREFGNDEGDFTGQR